MNVLVVGAGVIGTVYGAHLSAAGDVLVLAHGARTDAIASEGLRARDVLSGVETRTSATVVDSLNGKAFDLVLVTVRRDQLDHMDGILGALAGHPVFLFFGNNPQGRAGLPIGLPGPVALGFPGVGGSINETVADYVLIPQQPTALENSAEPLLDHFPACAGGPRVRRAEGA